MKKLVKRMLIFTIKVIIGMALTITPFIILELMTKNVIIAVILGIISLILLFKEI